MNAHHLVAVVAGCSTGAALVACGGDGPRMSVTTAHARAGESLVVRFEAPPVAHKARGDVWLTLVPVGSSDEFIGERVVIDEGASEATVPAGDEGRYELRLVDRSPRRLSGVVARLRVDVERAAVASREAPAWYW